MRTAVIVGSILVIMGLLVVLHPRTSDPASLVFRGYWDWHGYWTNYQGGLKADFILTNNTGRLLRTSQASGRVEVKTTSGWTNYPPGPGEVFLAGMEPILPHGTAWFQRDYPPRPVTWRLHVTYVVLPPRWSHLKIFAPVRSILGLQEKKKDAWSVEISDAPPR